MNHIEIDWSNYESPVSVDYIIREQEKQFEKDVLKVIASCNITVDADELVKALQYDRNQYQAGYKAGYEAAQQRENDELKRMLKLAMVDIEKISSHCSGFGCIDCPCKIGCEWKHYDEAMKLIGDD